MARPSGSGHVSCETMPGRKNTTAICRTRCRPKTAHAKNAVILFSAFSPIHARRNPLRPRKTVPPDGYFLLLLSRNRPSCYYWRSKMQTFSSTFSRGNSCKLPNRQKADGNTMPPCWLSSCSSHRPGWFSQDRRKTPPKAWLPGRPALSAKSGRSGRHQSPALCGQHVP